MNLLKQTEQQLLGSGRAIVELAGKAKVNILVISDSHGQRGLFKLITERMGKNCDALVFCGDGIGDFVSCLDDSGKEKLLAACIPPVGAFVAGNGDCDRFPARFNPEEKAAEKGQVYFDLKIPYSQIFVAAGRTIFIVHGHRQGVYYNREDLLAEAKKAGADIVLYGHTHIAREDHENGLYLMNPGSCAFPRGGLPPSFAVLEIGENYVTTVFYQIKTALNGIVFVPFDPGCRSLF
jgi:uncharacterized protein